MELPKQHLPTSLQLSELLTLSELALSNTSQYRIANTSQSETLEMLPEITKKSRPPRKNYNQLSSNEKLDNRQTEDIHIEEAAAESDASSTDLDERDTRNVCPPCRAHADRYNNNHRHDDFSDDSDYGKPLLFKLTIYKLISIDNFDTIRIYFAFVIRTTLHMSN
ncbi:unnamed protein product [Plutella xylostella]|uniref:(diamondback moth) hypothetical protein n=1 Tax=Plutella xylostella TaxID=51655 RepID=A0A8S4F3M6_PLUXY|nr:unnamed protein product [Plutella xylostella]